MPLILDHINGINDDNRLENLRFLCSNCDSIQDTYKSKNRKNKIDIIEKEKQKILNIASKLEAKNTKIQDNIYIVLKSNIDFSKMGWGAKIAKILNKSPQYCMKWIKKNMPEFYDLNCIKQKN
jgi:single-stranded DNA-specific DHH superfamily exonuclease